MEECFPSSRESLANAYIYALERSWKGLSVSPILAGVEVRAARRPTSLSMIYIPLKVASLFLFDVLSYVAEDPFVWRLVSGRRVRGTKRNSRPSRPSLRAASVRVSGRPGRPRRRHTTTSEPQHTQRLCQTVSPGTQTSSRLYATSRHQTVHVCSSSSSSRKRRKRTFPRTATLMRKRELWHL